MQVRAEEGLYLIRLTKGELLRQSLHEFARIHKVTGAMISGIGAVETADLAYFDEAEQCYVKKTVSGGLELLNLTGNISLVDDDEPMIHLHASLGTCDYSVIGGHLDEATVSVTAEIFVTNTNTIARKKPFGPFKLWEL